MMTCQATETKNYVYSSDTMNLHETKLYKRMSMMTKKCRYYITAHKRMLALLKSLSDHTLLTPNISYIVNNSMSYTNKI